MLVFFDIDGTLLDQRRAERAAAEAFLSQYGHRLAQPLSADQFCRLWKRLRELHLPAYLSGATSYREYHRRRIRDLFPDGASLSDHQLDTRFKSFHSSYRRAWQPFGDVHATLDRLQRHCLLGIISNGNAAHQRCKLRSMGVLHYFRVVVISEEVGVGKPDQAIFREACRRAQAAASECVCVGDRIDCDVQPSAATGMCGIWLNRRGKLATHPVKTIRSLLELVSGLESGWSTGEAPEPVAVDGQPERELFSE